MFFSSHKKIKYLIAGLGNPGEKYQNTRHNAGFLALDHAASEYGFRINSVKFNSLYARYRRGESEALFLKPQTYMNDSGLAVAQAARYYRLPPESILVVSDDINLPVGKLRIRAKGSDGGQKGLRSIGLHLSSEDFPRIRIGVGEKPHPDYDAVDWVLSKFSKEEEKAMLEAFSKVFECIDMFLAGEPIEQIQNKYN
ncbi:MAG: aminoacyl-tRNA hydrolase [Oscillospiraceae bacterium]|nr:aminoacyl-tRNA hydrolase [Oscillospiraceae bacterium]